MRGENENFINIRPFLKYVKILTYNTLRNHNSRRAAIEDVIKQANADIVCLQELNEFTLDNLNEWGTSLGYAVCALAEGVRTEKGNKYHVGTLSRYPLLLECAIKDVRHAALHTVIRTPVGDVSVMNVHLNPHSEDDRIQAIRSIIRAQYNFDLQVVCGDFNALSSSDAYGPADLAAFVSRGFVDWLKGDSVRTDAIAVIQASDYVDVVSVHVPVENRLTYPTLLGEGHCVRIDYIFCSAYIARHLISAGVIKNARTYRASDHYPVFGEFTEP